MVVSQYRISQQVVIRKARSAIYVVLIPTPFVEIIPSSITLADIDLLFRKLKMGSKTPEGHQQTPDGRFEAP